MLFFDCRIIKLSLQPIVENAIYHGIRPKRSSGMLTITAEPIRDSLYIYLSDDGIGIGKEALAELTEAIHNCNAPNSSQTYGLKNVHQRLQLAYGADYGISIESEIDVGTTVTVKIPFHTEIQPEIKEE